MAKIRPAMISKDFVDPGLQLMYEAAVQTHRRDGRSVRVGWSNWCSRRHLRFQALPHTKGSIPHGTGAVAPSDGQQHAKNLRATFVRQRRSQLALHAFEFGRHPAPTRRADRSIGRRLLNTAALHMPRHSQIDITEQTAKPRPVVVLDRLRLAALCAVPSAAPRRLELPEDDLALKSRNDLLAFGQPKTQHGQFFVARASDAGERNLAHRTALASYRQRHLAFHRRLRRSIGGQLSRRRKRLPATLHLLRPHQIERSRWPRIAQWPAGEPGRLRAASRSALQRRMPAIRSDPVRRQYDGGSCRLQQGVQRQRLCVQRRCEKTTCLQQFEDRAARQ